MREISIHTDYIKLSQLLKLAGCIDQGAEAKHLIEEGKVQVNGIVVCERGKKIRDQDEIMVDYKERFIVKFEDIRV